MRHGHGSILGDVLLVYCNLLTTTNLLLVLCVCCVWYCGTFFSNFEIWWTFRFDLFWFRLIDSLPQLVARLHSPVSSDTRYCGLLLAVVVFEPKVETNYCIQSACSLLRRCDVQFKIYHRFQKCSMAKLHFSLSILWRTYRADGRSSWPLAFHGKNTATTHTITTNKPTTILQSINNLQRCRSNKQKEGQTKMELDMQSAWAFW